MIIHQPGIEMKDGQVVFSARVERDPSRRDGKVQRSQLRKAFYRYPAAYAPMISGRSDAFLAALLPLAMASGEAIHVKGVCSPRLALGIEKLQEIFLWWFPDKLQKVCIHFDTLKPLQDSQAGEHCVSLFSGGADSSYTLMKHLPKNQQLTQMQVSHALFIHGLDIPLQNHSSYQQSLAVFEKELQPLEIETIPCETNLHYFYTGILKWEIVHGCVTIAAGLALDGLVQHLLMPATHSMNNLIPWGSSPITDHWLSTETIDVIHHGITTDRLNKLIAISSWMPAQRFLRVCVDEEKRLGIHNCGVCEKCLRTRITLEIIGAGGLIETFSPRLNPLHILKWVPHDGEVWVPQLIQYCRKIGKWRYIPLLLIAYLNSLAQKIARNFMPRSLFNWLRKKRFPADKDPFNPRFLETDDY